MIEAKGVIVARQTIEFATRGQINTAPNKTTTARISAFSIYNQKQVAANNATETSRSLFGSLASIHVAAFGSLGSIRIFAAIPTDDRLANKAQLFGTILAFIYGLF
jgi:hypothetical protein